MVLMAIGYGVYEHRVAVTRSHDFAAYLQAMTRVAVGRYTLAIATADAQVLRHYLATVPTVHAPTDYALSPGLRALKLEGGLVLEWFGHPVSMLCFTQEDKEPRDTEESDDHDVWFFVVSRAALPDAPVSEAPQFALAHGLITASWSRGDKTLAFPTSEFG
jgi:hypothetical protein